MTLMQKHKLTITSLSQMSGVPRTTLSDLINGRSTPTLRTASRVMKALLTI